MSYNEFHQNRTKMWKLWAGSNWPPKEIVRLSLRRFSRTSQLLNAVTWRSVPKSIHIGHKIWTVGYKIISALNNSHLLDGLYKALFFKISYKVVQTAWSLILDTDGYMDVSPLYAWCPLRNTKHDGIYTKLQHNTTLLWRCRYPSYNGTCARVIRHYTPNLGITRSRLLVSKTQPISNHIAVLTLQTDCYSTWRHRTSNRCKTTRSL